MTNNHIHIFALVPYQKLIGIVKKNDPELYDKIYVLKKETNFNRNIIRPVAINTDIIQDELKVATKDHPGLHEKIGRSIKSKRLTKKEFNRIFRTYPTAYQKVVPMIKKISHRLIVISKPIMPK